MAVEGAQSLADRLARNLPDGEDLLTPSLYPLLRVLDL